MNKYVKLVESTKEQKEQLDEIFGLFKKKIKVPSDVQAKLDPVLDDLSSQLTGVENMPPMFTKTPDMARSMIQTAIEAIKAEAKDADLAKQIITDLKKLIKKGYKSKAVKTGLSLVKEDTLAEAKKHGKKDYHIYHNSYSDAVTEVMAFIKKNGYDTDGEEFNDAVFNNISTGSKRPKKGQTTRVTLPLWKNGKEQRKAAHFQVYGMDDMKGRYELNLYIS